MPAYLGRAALVFALAATITLALAGVATAADPPPPAAPEAPPASEMPSCAEGPERVGDAVLGTPCDDRIVAPASVAAVFGGEGDDVIVGSNSGPVAAASGDPLAPGGLHLEVGSQTFEGGAGNDTVFGDRGNDTLRGNAGNDRLYGGIGDDVLEGGEGDDLLAGGFGADDIDGESGNDYVRGDATVDAIFDTGGGFDTLSFATAVTPGFFDENQGRGYPDFSAFGLPPLGGERGVYLNLAQGFADNDIPSLGGGIDEVEGASFEQVIGSPFADYIVGTTASQTILGGGGGDVILGGGGVDTLVGGPGGDFLEAEAGFSDGAAGDNCAGAAAHPAGCGAAKSVTQKAATDVAVGVIATGGVSMLSVAGSSGDDAITVSYGGSFVAISVPGRSFEFGPGCTPSGGAAACALPAALDAVNIAGLGGNDTIRTEGILDGVGVIETGGPGADHLVGGDNEDILVDGQGASGDILQALAGDDALTHNDGGDYLDGGQGSDLFLSVSVCDGEVIDGGEERVAPPTPDRDNASWARLGAIGVDARLDQGRVGEIGAGDEPVCSGGAFDALTRIEDLEASNQSDVLYGNEGNNQLLGHKGEDTYHALGGNDSILANSGSPDRVIDCGPGVDQAVIDLPSKAIDPTPFECESVREGAPEEFKELPLLSEPSPPPPVTPPPTESKPPPKDRKPPQTKLLRHPPKLLRVVPRQRKLVAFRFAASETSSFRCKLDRKPYAACRSPRKLRVAVGRHVFRLFAIDAAGNRDRSPAVFQFRVVAKKSRGATGAGR